MPIHTIPANSRGLTKSNWLKSYHSFSFGDYYDPLKKGFGKLRVLNEDVIGPSEGFPMHSHENMEIITLILKGRLEHGDSIGNYGLLKEGQMQRMSAGSGIRHSEFNSSKDQSLHLLQIWIFPNQRNLEPSYEQKEIPSFSLPDRWQMIVAPEIHPDTLLIHQDVRLFLGKIEPGMILKHRFNSNEKGGYCFLIQGQVEIQGKIIGEGDAVTIVSEKEFLLTAIQASFCLLIETPL